MNLQEEILREHSKKQAENIAFWAMEEPHNFIELIELFFSNQKVLTQRAGYALSKCSDVNPKCMEAYLPRFLAFMNHGIHSSVKRNALRVFELTNEIPEELEGELLDNCFKYLQNSHEEIAVKALSLTIAGKLCEKYPDLKNELKLVVEDQIEYSNPSFKVRVKRIFASL